MDAPPAESVASAPVRIGTDIIRVRPSAPPVAPLPAGWLHRFWFRFGAVYLLLFHIDWALEFVGLDAIALGHLVWRPLVPWVGQHVLRLDAPITVFPNGSGDTTYNYVEIWCLLVVSFIAALGWSWFDRRRRADPLIGEGVRVLLRYSLAAAMLSYGIAKVLHQQMGAPSFTRLVTPYGDSSPMGLLWTFLGQSAAYSAFAGLAEMVPGLLLLFRRTTTLGALLVAAVMLNVVMMNFCFDVPVKIYSTHLLVVSLVLVAPDAGRLFDLLVHRRPTQPRSFARVWPRPWLRPVAVALKVLAVGTLLYQIPIGRVREWAAERAKPKPELVGLYEVREFARDGVVAPPLLTDAPRWRYVAMNLRGTFIVVRMNGERTSYRAKLERGSDKLVLSENVFPPRAAGVPVPKPVVVRFKKVAPGVVEFRGEFDGRMLMARVQEIDESKFLLVNRGFNWVNEYPVNR